MTIRNKRRHLHHAQKLKRTLLDYGIDPFGTGPSQNLVTGKEIDGDLVKGSLGAAKTGNKAYLNFVNQRLVEGNKTLFNPIPKINLMTGMETKKRKSKEVSVLTEDKQAFGIIISKAASLEEAFKYPITSLPLSIAMPDGSLYQTEKAPLRKQIIGDANTTRYLQNATWIVDGMYAIRSVKPKETYNHYFVDLFNYILPPQDAKATSLHFVMGVYKPNSTKEGIRRKRGEDGNRVHVSGFEQKMPRGNKWIEFLSNGQN